MAYQHPRQRYATNLPVSTPNHHSLPPALLQALHRLATFSSDIQLLTSHFAPHLHFHAHHPCFSKPTPQHFARCRKPTTRSTVWRLQNLQPNPITHLQDSNVTPSSLIATPITNAPPRPVSAPPFNPTRYDSEIPGSSSVPPGIARSRTPTEPAIDLMPVHLVSESTGNVDTESVHDSSEPGDNSVTTDDVGEALIRPAFVQMVFEPQTATADNPERDATILPPRIADDLAFVTEIDLILNAVKPAMILSPVPVIEDRTSSAANPIVHALDSQTFPNDDPTLTAAIDLSPTSDSGTETDPPPATNSSISILLPLLSILHLSWMLVV